MENKGIVIELIRNKAENALCDFKSTFYHEAKKQELIKDIVAFANCTQPGDKYIVFNINNDTRVLGSMSSKEIPDISEVNSLLREYCEPNINIEMNSFFLDEHFIAYIKICSTNMDCPYMIKKDFIRRGEVLLRQGQIFIRRNADNFQANRRDLDEIYNSREQYDVSVFRDTIVAQELTINKVTCVFYRLRVFIKNNSRINFLIENAEICLSSTTHAVSFKVKYIDDEPTSKVLQIKKITDVPYSVPQYTMLQKSAFFEVSEPCAERLQNIIKCGEKLSIEISIQSTDKKTIVSTPTMGVIQYRNSIM